MSQSACFSSKILCVVINLVPRAFPSKHGWGGKSHPIFEGEALGRGWATAPLRSSPGGGVRGGELGAAGIDCYIMHMAGYFEVISFLILPVFNFLILFNKKKKKIAVELYHVIFTPAPGLPTTLGEAERANLISRFWLDSISQGFIFAISTGKYEQRILNFAIQVFSTSL